MEQTNLVLKLKEEYLESIDYKYFEEAAKLLRELSGILDNFDRIFANDKNIKALALDYTMLDQIKGIAIENKGNNEEIIRQLSFYLTFIESHDKEFESTIKMYSFNLKKEKKVDYILRQLASDPQKLISNLDLALKAAEQIKDTLLQAKVKARINLIARYYSEILSLEHNMLDIENWSHYFHEGISYYVQKISLYIKGGKDKSVYFEGLEKFKDEQLLKVIGLSKEVKTLILLASLTNRSQEQYEFISSLIAYLQRDIENNEWVRNESTKRFFEDIDKHAAKFNELGNRAFANMLLSNKKAIGEQPFKWINLLDSMSIRITNWMRLKSTVIENARIALQNLFRERIQQLSESISRNKEELYRILVPETNLSKQIEEGIRRVEKAVYRKWKARKKRFKKVKVEIDSRLVDIAPKLQRVAQDITVIEESIDLAKQNELLLKYSQHMKEVVQRVGFYPSQNKFGLIAMLLYNIKNKERVHTIIPLILANTNQKIANLKKTDFKDLISKTKELLQLFMQLLVFVGLFRTTINAKNYSSRIIALVGDAHDSRA